MEQPISEPDPECVKHYRTLFISDIHLGTRACQAEAFLDFFKHHSAETIYLVGDIVDFWCIRRRGAYWPQSQNDVIQKLLRRVRKGTRMIYIPGNHDEALREYCGMHFGGVEFVRNAVHVTADGRRFVVMHGDEFDVVVRYSKWLAILGDWAYEIALGLNTYFNIIRRIIGMPYWSLSAYLKHKVKSAVSFIGEFETALAGEAERENANGIICGHIHHATIEDINGVTYINTGDWVESCTAVGETFEGEFEIIRWVNTLHQKHNAKRKDIEALA
ncbi:MAG: UDP-2,3-diacylglucosamine diphosphatase [Pseudomonadota bacterium]